MSAKDARYPARLVPWKYFYRGNLLAVITSPLNNSVGDQRGHIKYLLLNGTCHSVPGNNNQATTRMAQGLWLQSSEENDSPGGIRKWN